MSDNTIIKCPKCDFEIDVNTVLHTQFKNKLDREYIAQRKALDSQAKEQNEKHEKGIADLKKKEKFLEKTQEQFEEKVEIAIKNEKKKLYNDIKFELEEEQNEARIFLEKELAEKSKQVKELNISKAMIQKLTMEKSETENKIKADVERDFNKKLQDEREKLKIDQLKANEKFKKNLENEQNEAKILLEKELAEKSKQVKELNTSKAMIQKLTMEKSETENKIKADVERDFNKKLQDEREKLKIDQLKANEEFKKNIENEQNESILLLEKELTKKSEQVKELNNSKIEIEKLKREKEEATSVAKLEAEKDLSEKLKIEKEKFAKIASIEKGKLEKEIQESNNLKLKAKDEQLEQIKRDLENARRKAQQGSMQIQGEVFELTIENWLSKQFHFDIIEEIKKGAFGADCIQTIHTRELQNCGIICYESKNTKAWSNEWIPKLKKDMQKVNADIGVLVTSVFPKNMNRMGFLEGVWVCSLDEFKGSSALLRESLIRVYKTSKSEENKGEKMAQLYTYMTGKDFPMQITAIVDGFEKMRDLLEKEKRSLQASWKQREMTINEVLRNTAEMYGALQSISGAVSIETIDALELKSPKKYS